MHGRDDHVQGHEAIRMENADPAMHMLNEVYEILLESVNSNA